MAYQFILDQFLLFTLVVCRVSGLVMTAPVFGAPDVPMQVRAFLAVALSVLVMPLVWGQTLTPPGALIHYLVIVGAEVLIGFTLGMAVNILLSGIQVAANIIGQMSGLQMAEVYNPLSDASGPVFAQIMYYVTVAVFVLIGGHRKLLGALLDTFVWLPPGLERLPADLSTAATELITQSFVLAIRARGPSANGPAVVPVGIGSDQPHNAATERQRTGIRRQLADRHGRARHLAGRHGLDVPGPYRHHARFGDRLIPAGKRPSAGVRWPVIKTAETRRLGDYTEQHDSSRLLFLTSAPCVLRVSVTPRFVIIMLDLTDG